MVAIVYAIYTHETLPAMALNINKVNHKQAIIQSWRVCVRPTQRRFVQRNWQTIFLVVRTTTAHKVNGDAPEHAPSIRQQRNGQQQHHNFCVWRPSSPHVCVLVTLCELGDCVARGNLEHTIFGMNQNIIMHFCVRLCMCARSTASRCVRCVRELAWPDALHE